MDTMDTGDFCGECGNPACTEPTSFAVPMTPHSIVDLVCRSCGTGYSLHVSGDAPPVARLLTVGLTPRVDIIALG